MVSIAITGIIDQIVAGVYEIMSSKREKFRSPESGVRIWIPACAGMTEGGAG